MKFRLVILIICAALKLIASDKNISGIVLDAETKEPLPFANIVVLKKLTGTVSNSEGSFVLNLDGIEETDTVSFSYIGYGTTKVTVSELQSPVTIYLKPAPVSLSEVQVKYKSRTPEEIVKMVRENFSANHASVSERQKVFYHRYEKAPFNKANQLVLKKSDFPGIDKKMMEDLIKKIPSEFIGYQDAIVELYNDGEDYKLIPVKAISLEESTQLALLKEVELKLGSFIKDFEKSNTDPDTYYKIRTGIIGTKLEYSKQEEAAWNEYKNDTLNYTVQTDLVTNEILFLFKEYANIESKNWDFINHIARYDYQMDGIESYNDDLIYKISFKPKSQGLFQGIMHISTSSFAILQLDFAFANGKKTEKFQMLGFGHSMNFKEGRVIFEKGKTGYSPKYIYAHQKEFVSINRNFSLVKKQKRFFLDKELHEIKLEAEMSFENQNFWEILVLDKQEISANDFDRAKEPKTIKFKKVFSYSPDMWDNNTILAPASELKKYKRQ